MYTTRLSPPRAYRTQVTAHGRALQLGGAARPIALTRITQGLRGPAGSSGEAQLSADPGNALTQGTDTRLFVPAAFTLAARLAELAENPAAQAQARQNLGVEVIDGGTFN